MLEKRKYGMVQFELKNASGKAVDIIVKGKGTKTLYPGESIILDNRTKYTTRGRE